MAKDWTDELGILQEEISSTTEDIEPSEMLDAPLDEASFDRNQVVILCKQELNFLAAVAMPEVFIYNFPPVLITVWQLLLQYLDQPKKFPKLALGIPRGHAKTTLIKLFVLYCILFSNKKFILVIAETSSKAEEIIADVFDFLNHDNIKTLFGDWKFGAEKDTHELKKFGFRGRNIVVGAIGAQGALRGLNVKNTRPDIIIFEDVQSRECADSVVQTEALERWMVGTAMKAKSPEGCLFIFVANMYPTPNSLLKKMKSDPTWIKFINGAILADGTALWEELRSLESLLEELEGDMAAGHPEIFFAEVLNDTDAGLNQTIDFTNFKYWPWSEHDHPQGKFIIIDPSQGKGKDSDAIGVMEVYDGKIGVKDIIVGKYSPGNLIRRTLIEAFRTGTRLIAIESMAYQFTLLYWFDTICKSLGIKGIMVVEIFNSVQAKNSRIASGLKALQANEIILHDSIRSKVQAQIANWQPLKRDNVDDMLDVIAYAPKVLADHPFDIQTTFAEALSEGSEGDVEEDNHCF